MFPCKGIKWENMYKVLRLMSGIKWQQVSNNSSSASAFSEKPSAVPCIHFSSVQFSHSVVSDSWRPHESQHARPPSPSPTPGVYSNSCPSSRWCIQSSQPLSSPPAPNPSQHQGLFRWVNSSHELAKVLEFQLHHQSFQWTYRTDLL